jgi:hypothetical protein
VELKGKDKKIQSEGQANLRRAMAHLKKNSMSWKTNKKLMYGATEYGTGYNGIAHAYGLFRSLVTSILVAAPRPYFENTASPGHPLAMLLGDACWFDFKIGRLKDRLIKSLWQNFPYGLGYIAEQMETNKVPTVDGKDKPDGEQMITSQRYYWKNIPPRDVAHDPDGFQIDLDDHQYCCIAYYKTIAEILADKTYFNLDKIEEFPRANETTETGKSKYFSYGQADKEAAENPEFHQIKIWRIYDRVSETVRDFADHDKRLMRNQPWPMPVEIQGILQFPIRILAMNTETDDFYPTPEVDLIKPQLRSLIRMNDIMMTDLTTKLRKYIGLAPYVDQAKMEKLIAMNQPNSFVITSNEDVLHLKSDMPKVDSASDVVHRMPDIQVDPQLFSGMAEVRTQIQQITAYGAAERGGLPAIRSAKEASRVAEAAQKSMLGRQGTMEDLTRDVAMYHVLLLKNSSSEFSEDRYVRISDRAGALVEWKKFNPSEIPNEQDLFCDIYIGSSTPMTLDSKKAMMNQEIGVLGPLLQKEGLPITPLIYRWAEVNQVRDIDELFRNAKGAARTALGALVKAGQLGEQAPPELLLKPLLDLIDATLSPMEKQMVIAALTGKGKPGGGGGGGSLPSGEAPGTAMSGVS